MLIGAIQTNTIPLVLLWKRPWTGRVQGQTNTGFDDTVKCETNISVLPVDANITTETLQSGKCDTANFFTGQSKNNYNNSTSDISSEINSSTSNLQSCEKVDNKSATIELEIDIDKTIAELNKTSDSTCKALVQLLMDVPFMLCGTGIALASAAGFVLQIFVQDVFLDASYTKDDASLALTLISLCSIVGRISPGLLLQTKHISVAFLLSIVSVCMAFGTVGVILFSSLVMKLISVSIAGIPCGMFVTMYSIMPYELVQTRRLSTAIGLVMSFSGVTIVTSGLISGKAL